MSRCFFHPFAPKGIRDCDGRLQNHHAIKQQTIRRLMAPARPHMMLDDELRVIKAALAKALRDPRNSLSACKRHHALWHNGRIRVSRGDIPSELEDFAAEYELVFELDRQFGPLEGGEGL